MDRKLLRGNIRGKGRFWLNLATRILTEGKEGDQTPPVGYWRMRNLIRY